ncbi:uncharacterized protein LOC124166504 [Ischnura elegans]|uniref:uncharacterized protein LOC124166504 n=1 Tax=Ischnura elegans TaxID=197161 RepID=UPI001ED87043|nr:uncharacterized protein LOC124166504 [Ischnura elegans]
MEELQRQLNLLKQENEELRQKTQLATHANAGELDEHQTTRTLGVHRVTPKLPLFWPDNPIVWFAQVEAQFALSGITQDATQYGYVASHLDARWAAEVQDILTNPPSEGRYICLKEELIRRLSLSEEKRVRQLLTEEELGERTPSQFLRHLRNLAGTTQVQDNLLRTLWLQRLPAAVQAILQVQLTLPLDEVAKLADRIIEVSSPSVPAGICAATSTPTNDPIASLTKQLQNLSQQVDALQLSSRCNHR